MCHSPRAACALSTRAVRKPQLHRLETADDRDGREADRVSRSDLQEMMQEAVRFCAMSCDRRLSWTATRCHKRTTEGEIKGMRKEVYKDQKVPLQ